MKIILTTTASFFNTVSASDLAERLAALDTRVVLHYEFAAPFPFDPKEVLAIVAGHTPKGEMLHVGPQEAAWFPNLRVVSPFGVGTNHLDIAGLEQAGIKVRTIPHFSKRTVAELAIAFVFALARRLMPLSRAIQNGVWQRQDAINIGGKTLGIIGLGAIGKEVAKLGSAVGLKVVANDLVYDDHFMEEWGIEKRGKEEVVKTADFLTLHVPYTPETKNLIDEKMIASMKKGSYLINAARGEVIDEAALLVALETGHLAGAALDVFSAEPPFSSEVLAKLIKLPNVISTPHVGAFTGETRYQIAEHLCETLPKDF